MKHLCVYDGSQTVHRGRFDNFDFTTLDPDVSYTIQVSNTMSLEDYLDRFDESERPSIRHIVEMIIKASDNKLNASQMLRDFSASVKKPLGLLEATRLIEVIT